MLPRTQALHLPCKQLSWYIILSAVGMQTISRFFLLLRCTTCLGLFNHPQFALPASTIGSTGVGTVSATARSSRQIQFALKLLF